MKKKHDEGFSLVEVLVAIVLLAAFVVPTCSALTMAARMNGRTEELMQAQLDVSSAVETLMAEGISQNIREKAKGNNDGLLYEDIRFPDVNIVIEALSEENIPLPWCTVTVSDKESLVTVKTSVRVVSGGGS